jgi:small subunit ribosomal protein S13
MIDPRIAGFFRKRLSEERLRHEGQVIGSADLRKLQDRPSQGNGAGHLHQHQAQAEAGLVRSRLLSGSSLCFPASAFIVSQFGATAHNGFGDSNMPRISGIDIPPDKPTWISLSYLYGVGRTNARQVLKEAGIDHQKRAKDLTDEEIAKILALFEKHNILVEGALRRSNQQNVNRLREIGCYRGNRHRRSLPVRGQRTRSNARTRKGPRKTVAGKKGVKELGK